MIRLSLPVFFLILVDLDLILVYIAEIRVRLSPKSPHGFARIKGLLWFPCCCRLFVAWGPFACASALWVTGWDHEIPKRCWRDQSPGAWWPPENLKKLPVWGTIFCRPQHFDLLERPVSNVWSFFFLHFLVEWIFASSFWQNHQCD